MSECLRDRKHSIFRWSRAVHAEEMDTLSARALQSPKSSLLQAGRLFLEDLRGLGSRSRATWQAVPLSAVATGSCPASFTSHVHSSSLRTGSLCKYYWMCEAQKLEAMLYNAQQKTVASSRSMCKWNVEGPYQELAQEACFQCFRSSH